MGRRISRVGSLCVVLAAVVSACAPVEPGAVSSSELTFASYDAAYRIAAARCDRDMSGCATFSSRSACIDAKLSPSVADARLQRCLDPIDEVHLRECLADIRRSTCRTAIGSIEACRRIALCPFVT